MRRLLLIPLILLFSGALLAQDKQEQQPSLRTISITGNASQEIEPDVLYFSITLREYQSKIGSKIGIEELEQQLKNAVKKAKIPSENLTVENIFGYNYSYWKQKQNKDFMSRKQYELKLTDTKYLDAILDQIDPKGIENARIKQYTHSKIEDFKQQLQIKALQNAKEQANKLVNSIDSELGEVLQIQENTKGYQPVYYQQAGSNRMMAMDSGMRESSVDLKKIKIEAEIQVVFRIK